MERELGGVVDSVLEAVPSRSCEYFLVMLRLQCFGGAWHILRGACSVWRGVAFYPRAQASRVIGRAKRAPHWGCSIEISRDIYIYYIGTRNGPIKLVRRGGIYFDVPPQCSTPDTAHGQWVRRYGYSSSS